MTRRELAERTAQQVGCRVCRDFSDSGNGMSEHGTADTIERALAVWAAPLVQELRNIANADPRKWDEDVRDQFEPWAKSRANAALAQHEAAAGDKAGGS